MTEITPGPSQLDQWEMAARATTDPSLLNERTILSGHFGVVHRKALCLAFAAAAEQELEACCEWVSKYLPYLGDFPMPEDKLRAARRPKRPSLKERIAAAITDGNVSTALELLNEALPNE